MKWFRKIMTLDLIASFSTADIMYFFQVATTLWMGIEINNFHS